jgi:hypothetical protein
MVTIMGQEVAFASPEDLIIHKIFAGRPRDLEDVKSVIIKNKDIDIPYICNRLKEFDTLSDRKDFINLLEETLKEIGI